MDTESATPEPNWYLNPDDPTTERFWNGSQFEPGARVPDPATRPFPGSPTRPLISDPYQRRMLDLAASQLHQQVRAANYLAVMAAVTVFGLVVALVVALNAR